MAAVPPSPAHRLEVRLGSVDRMVAWLLPLPACHKGVYARRSLSSGRPKAGPVGRAMERAGVRGRAARLRLAESPPHPGPLPPWGEREKKGGTARYLFSAGDLAMRLAFRLLLGLEVFTGLLVDHLHRQPNLTAFVEAQQLDFHLVAFLD